MLGCDVPRVAREMRAKSRERKGETEEGREWDGAGNEMKKERERGERNEEKNGTAAFRSSLSEFR